MGASRQNTPPLAFEAGADETTVRAAQSTSRVTSLRVSLFSMTFSFAVSRSKPLRLRGAGNVGTISAARRGVND